MANKYLNHKSHGFDSKLEEKRYEILKLAESQGIIQRVQCQRKFELIPPQKGDNRNERKVEYIADFVYYKHAQMIVEDTKSPYSRKLPAYVIKRKLMLYQYNISIREITKDNLEEI